MSFVYAGLHVKIHEENEEEGTHFFEKKYLPLIDFIAFINEKKPKKVLNAFQSYIIFDKSKYQDDDEVKAKVAEFLASQRKAGLETHIN